MTLSKRDYENIASAIRMTRRYEPKPAISDTFDEGHTTGYSTALNLAVEAVADALEQTNPKFNRRLFIESCQEVQ